MLLGLTAKHADIFGFDLRELLNLTTVRKRTRLSPRTAANARLLADEYAETGNFRVLMCVACSPSLERHSLSVDRQPQYHPG